jgi:hypothetical protein
MARLPVMRPLERSHDPAHSLMPSLPSAEEADDEGSFARALEERIAVGDPECRVVVSLAPDPSGEAGLGHSYSATPGQRTAGTDQLG